MAWIPVGPGHKYDAFIASSLMLSGVFVSNNKRLICCGVTDQGNSTTMMKHTIFGIATRIDLLEFIMQGDTQSSSGDGAITNGSG